MGALSNLARRLLDRIARAPRPSRPLPPPIDPQDWRAGDIAECIVDDWFRDDGESAAGPRLGDRHRVDAIVGDLCACPTCAGRLFLVLPRFAARFDSTGFRKVRPQADELLAAEPAFRDRLLVAPEVKARLDRWELRGQIAILTAAALVCSDSLIAALTRGPA